MEVAYREKAEHVAELRAASADPPAALLAGGARFQGRGIGSLGAVAGELVFTTAMTGYQEALTDPSYRGQILLFTYPLIGNYGVAPGRQQSDDVHVRGAIVSTLSDSASGVASLRDYLVAHQVPTLYGVDTRAIAQLIRVHGAMPAVLSIHEADHEPEQDALAAQQAEAYDTTDFVAQTTVSQPAVFGTGRRLIALLDCGAKRSMIDELTRRDCQVAVLPAHTPASRIRALAPDALVISNGPGNPESAQAVIDTIRELYGDMPLFGVCLGHQLLALAAGGRTYKLPFGHRGANHPVQDCTNGRAFVTTQNHGYAVDAGSLPSELSISHRNLNDGTVEGLRHRTLPIGSVQFHPEGAPGPRDAGVVLDGWLESVA